MRLPTSGLARDAAIAFAVLVTRLPFVGPGAGIDNDGWFLVNAAREMAATGRYTTSRFPGYPVQEWLASLVVRAGGDVWAITFLSALACAVCVFGLARFLRGLGVGEASLLAGAFAFVPAIAVASVSAMDYLFALAFVLTAAHARVSGRHLLMGVALGLAIGTRLTSVVLLPAVLLLPPPGVGRRDEGARLLTAISITTLIAAACYVPAYQRYGMAFLQFVDPLHTGSTPWDFVAGFLHLERSPFPPALVIGQATALLWGIPGTLALVGAFGWSALGRGPAPAGPLGGGRVLAACGAALVCEGALYLRLPHDEGYLIPVVPFVLLLLGRAAPRALVRVCAAAFVLSAFVLGVDAVPPKKGIPPATPSVGAFHRGAAGREAVIEPLRGPLLLDHAKRRSAAAVCDSTLAARATGLPRTFVIAGVLSAELVARGGLDRAHPWLADVVTEAALRDSLAAGAQVVLLPGARARHRLLLGYDPLVEGVRIPPTRTDE